LGWPNLDWRVTARGRALVADAALSMIFVCWKWYSAHYPTKFTAEHVNILAAMLKQHATVTRLICITDDPEGVECETFPLWDDLGKTFNPNGRQYPSCYRRLKLFDPAMTRAMGIIDGTPIVSIDLDVVIVREINRLVDMWPEDHFVGWRALSGYAWKRPRYLNGSIWRLRAGMLPFIWTEFDPLTTPQLIYDQGYFGTDQGWLSLRLSERRAWDDSHGIYAWSWIRALPTNARIICFNGPEKPWHDNVRREAPWIQAHYRR
jgi:hypothetical protein